MDVERDRLISVLEFARQSALLRSKPAAAITQHKLFNLHEHEIQGLPGINLNVSGSESEDEVWCTIERLHEVRPPEIASRFLLPWVHGIENPAEEPALSESTGGSSLIGAGTHCSSAEKPQPSKPQIAPELTVSLSGYQMEDSVRRDFQAYLETKWLPWASEEKLRRKTISIYSRIFTLRQQLHGGLSEAQLELVWGVGIGVWSHNGTEVLYPLIGRLVELSIDPQTARIEIRPRDVEARLELEWYASVGNSGVPGLEKTAKEILEEEETPFSPFDRGSFEPLLRAAATHLDGEGPGVYWPDTARPGDRKLPKPDHKLKVTDTWVLFARPRTNSLFLQDLERLKAEVEDADSYPPAAAALITDPETANPVVELPSFRGLSASYHDASRTAGKDARDLHFPKPFNDEQVRIIQHLEVSPGVIVQGPPGTGKTHTIANIICHYLAEGKRVLVTSMKDPALGVLREQLPDEIRSLAISLLTSEQEGMKQFEHAIKKIASEVQALDRIAAAKEIGQLEEGIDALHGRLAHLDCEIAEFARRNLSKIRLEEEEFDPQDAAREIVENDAECELIPDALGIDPEFAPQFSDGDIVRLRDARRGLGADICYLGSSLPQLVEFPDPMDLLEVHRDLAQFEKLKQVIEKGEIPALSNSRQETLAAAQQLLRQIEEMRGLQEEIKCVQATWTDAAFRWIRSRENGDLLKMFEALGAELEQASQRRNEFLDRPIAAPPGIESDIVIMQAVGNLAAGRKPFGVMGMFGKGSQRRQLGTIRVLGDPPSDAESWNHVLEYLGLRKCLSELGMRWNALAGQLSMEALPCKAPEDCLAAVGSYRTFVKIKKLAALQTQVERTAPRLFPAWPRAGEATRSVEYLSELDKALRHHLTKQRLAGVWVTKERIEKVLKGRSGPVVDEIRRFLRETFGNPNISDAEMQAGWSALMAELSRALGLGTHLSAVREVCEKISASGAPRYAELLKQPLMTTTDALLPVNWRRSWRLRRLATYLESVDKHEDLKKLTKERGVAEKALSRSYREVVVKRSWLKLAENASPSVRAALQAYLGAIRKIGKGTGKSAVRYRHDARAAASQANPAIPCWIMAHYRVSESLPPQLGCFDLVVIDEASQSDMTALPALLRAKKLLIVGDDKQVSPEGVGLDEQKVRSLMSRFLGNQVSVYGPLMSPLHSIYDLFSVVFARSAVMLREHFRSVGPIIEYSKREFYNHELRPLRLPKASERLDPPLVDVLVKDGYRNGDINIPEARFIVSEIKAIAADPKMAGRSIGVVSLLADKQALETWQRLTEELGPELMERHRITCGDARTFQGKERDIMFLSMVSAPNENTITPLARDTFYQRFNVAASRARDRMYLVRSVEADQLRSADALRRGLIAHFNAPFAQDEKRVEDLRDRCESPFECELYDELTKRSYKVTPQVRIGHYRIDLVVDGDNDARLAVECDGDRYHGPEKWAEDLERQRILERAGWVFWRCFASTFIRKRKATLDDLFTTLTEQGITPIGADTAPRSVHTEHRVVSSSMPSDETPEEVYSGDALETDREHFSEQQSDYTSGIDESASVQTRAPIENGEFAVGNEALLEKGREKRPHSAPQPRPVQLKAQFEKRPGEAAAQPHRAAQHPKTHSKVQSLPERAFKREDRVSEAPEILPVGQTAKSGQVADPLSETLLTFVPDDLQHCQTCHRKRALLIGRFGPYLKCPECGATGQIPHAAFVDTVSRLKPLCEKCGCPVRAVQYRGRSFLGCSGYPDCRHTESWKALAIRLKEKSSIKN